ncbi:MAG: hypothetical protein R3F11_05725 [Verrucomicrobiales bacterium]
MEQYVDVLQVFHLTCPDRDELSRRLKKRALKDNRFDDASDTVIKRLPKLMRRRPSRCSTIIRLTGSR